ncbi:N-acyl-D-amino-acid deacylase family protein [Novosphingobium aquimarinum]|uniref:N-acyl-D-amino-acid deacylase family protein n=1 Tax=Novosphingobium aquimarinum TaxID=2682494 RepID=UPI0012EC189A|nr:amidohydrolase family protein [Novosphingobium aquimarinum]
MSDMLIQGGTVVDGTGAPGFKADVRLQGDRIVEVGADLKPQDGEEVVDASGCYVAPGFIEGHTHYDATMWWQPDLDPLPGVGATTIITGNCGFTAAPLSQDKAAQMEMIKIFSFFEDIPLEPFLKNVPWDWRSWPEYKTSVEKNVRLPLNHAAYVGHIALRMAAMGTDAWERPANEDERAKMAKLLDEALANGALGLSTNLLDHDGENRPIPSLVADDAEFSALFDVLDQYPATTFQCIIDVGLMRDTGPEQTDRMAKLLKGRNIRVQLTGAIPTVAYQKYLLQPMRDRVEQMRKDGIDVWPGYAHVPLTGQLSLYKSLIFAQSNDYVWHEVVLADGAEAKEALLRDPDWRARARESWDTQCYPQSPMNNPGMLLLTELGSDNGAGPFCTLEEYAKERGLHRSDAMADWLLANGVLSTVRMAPFDMDDEVVVEMIRDPKTVGNITDAGAHLQMLCGGGENLIYLTKYVRDQKAISVEEAVHSMTGKLAKHFHLTDIGEIKEGKRADIVVFDFDEIRQHDMEKVYDVTDGKGGTTWRYTRKAAPMKLTLVNGEPIFRDGAYTGVKAGAFLEPAQNDDTVAIAAE